MSRGFSSLLKVVVERMFFTARILRLLTAGPARYLVALDGRYDESTRALAARISWRQEPPRQVAMDALSLDGQAP